MYAPNPLTHLVQADRADLFCSPCAQYCSESNPCLCDTQIRMTPAVPDPLSRAKAPKTNIQHKSDSDSGSAEDSHG